MRRRHLGPFKRVNRPFKAMTTSSAARLPDQRGHPGNLFTAAYATRRPCYGYSCICLTRRERIYERRVFRLARAWSRMLDAERRANHQITI